MAGRRAQAGVDLEGNRSWVGRAGHRRRSCLHSRRSGAGPIEHVIALDADGRKLWAVPIAKAYDFRGNVWSLGPNNTPSVDGHMIFALGGQGMFGCVDDTGKERWRVDLVKDLKGQVNAVTGEGLGWGFNWSPLVAAIGLSSPPAATVGCCAALERRPGPWSGGRKRSPMIARIHRRSWRPSATCRRLFTRLKTRCTACRQPMAYLLWAYEKKRQAENLRGDSNGSRGSDFGVRIGRRDGIVQSRENRVRFHGRDGLVRQAVCQFARRRWCGSMATFMARMKSEPGSVLTFSPVKKPGNAQARRRIGHICRWLPVLRQSGRRDRVIDRGIAKRDAIERPVRVARKIQAAATDNAGLWTHPVVANGRLYLRDQELLFCYNVK